MPTDTTPPTSDPQTDSRTLPDNWLDPDERARSVDVIQRWIPTADNVAHAIYTLHQLDATLGILLLGRWVLAVAKTDPAVTPAQQGLFETFAAWAAHEPLSDDLLLKCIPDTPPAPSTPQTQAWADVGVLLGECLLETPSSVRPLHFIRLTCYIVTYARRSGPSDTVIEATLLAQLRDLIPDAVDTLVRLKAHDRT